MKILTNTLIIVFLISSISITTLSAQVGIATAFPNPSAMLDIDVTNQGILFPQIPLVNSTDVITISNPETSLLVFNTTNVNDITMGYRYWNGMRWVPFIVDEVQTIRYSNTNHIGGSLGNRTDLYQLGGVNAPIFGVLEWNDNTSLFSVNTNTHELTVQEAGTFRIECSLFYTVDEADYALKAQ